MKILFLTKFFQDLLPSEHLRIVKNIASELSKSNDVTVIKPLPVIPKFLYKLSKDWKNYSEHPLHIREDFDVFYPKYKRFPLSYYYYDDKSIEKVTYSFLESNNIDFDIMYSHWPYPDGAAALRIARRRNKKFVLHFHGGNPQFFLNNNRIKERVQWVLDNSDLVIFVSNGIKNETEKYFRLNKYCVIHNGINQELFYPTDKTTARLKLNIPLEKKILLSVAYLKKAKRIDLVINALHTIQDENILYYIIGDGEEKQNLLDLVSRYKLSNRVKFIGSCKYEDIPLWMNAADLLVQPSDYESFGQIFVESLLCQTSVIGTNVGGIPEIIKSNENGILIEPNNVVQLTKAINYSLQKRWDNNFLSYSVNEYSLQKMCEKIIGEFKRITNIHNKDI